MRNSAPRDRGRIKILIRTYERSYYKVTPTVNTFKYLKTQIKLAIKKANIVKICIRKCHNSLLILFAQRIGKPCLYNCAKYAHNRHTVFSTLSCECQLAALHFKKESQSFSETDAARVSSARGGG
jgi:hypothetical protein